MFSSLARAAACAVLFAPLPLFAQQAGDAPASGIYRVNGLIENPNLPQYIDPYFAPPLVVKPRLNPIGQEPLPPAPAVPNQSLTDFKLSQTYLPRVADNGFGTNDTEFSAQFALPWEPCGKPILLRGGFGVHEWDGPRPKRASVDPALPGAVYDLYADIGWKPRPAEWLFFDLGITPGIYSDFHSLNADAFRLRGRALSIVALSEKFQFVGGVLYVNRNGPKVVPAGGFIWQPHEATKFQIVFPQPKISQRVCTVGDKAWWLYLAGEFGGGTWAYERPDGSNTSADYNDYRLIVGSELRRADGWNLRAEVGYVFGRSIDPLNTPRIHPADTMMARLSLNY